MSAWLMDGLAVKGTRFLTGVMDVVHVDDANGDAKPDVAPRALHLMGSVDVATAIPLTQNRIVTHVGDFNGDGKIDFVWRDYATGTTSIELRNGLTSVVDPPILSVADWPALPTPSRRADMTVA